MTTIPQTGGLKTEGVKAIPYGADVFIDFERGRQFVTLCYRHKDAGPRETQLAFVLAILDDLTANSQIIDRGGLDIRLTPVLETRPGGINGVGQVQTPDTPYRIHVKVPIAYQMAAQAEVDGFIAGLRTRFADRDLVEKALGEKKGRRA